MFVEWEKLPRKTISSAGLFFDSEGRILILKPNYKEGWGIPGGTIELQESPVEGFVREVKEEIGLIKKPLRLLCVDYVTLARSGHDHISLVFEGGVLTPEEIASIVLQTEELIEYKFATIDEALGLLAAPLAKRLPAGMKARAANKTIYLENGEELK